MISATLLLTCTLIFIYFKKELRPPQHKVKMAEQVQVIVNQLNEEPFRKGLTLVSFDKKSPLDLVQLLQEVIEEVYSEFLLFPSHGCLQVSVYQKVDLRAETPEETAQRMFDFLWILKYKSNIADP